MHGLVGQDGFGAVLKARLAECGVADRLQCIGEAQTGCCIVLSSSADRGFVTHQGIRMPRSRPMCPVLSCSPSTRACVRRHGPAGGRALGGGGQRHPTPHSRRRHTHAHAHRPLDSPPLDSNPAALGRGVGPSPRGRSLLVPQAAAPAGTLNPVVTVRYRRASHSFPGHELQRHPRVGRARDGGAVAGV